MEDGNVSPGFGFCCCELISWCDCPMERSGPKGLLSFIASPHEDSASITPPSPTTPKLMFLGVGGEGVVEGPKGGRPYMPAAGAFLYELEWCYTSARALGLHNKYK